MNINEIQDQIIEEFSMFPDWMDKYEYIIELGKQLPQIDGQYKTEDNLVHGCQSQVWLHADMQDDKLMLTADSDAMITKGIIALLVRVFSDHTAEDVSQTELYFIEKIGLQEHLSMTRANGLQNMIAKIKSIAAAIHTVLFEQEKLKR